MGSAVNIEAATRAGDLLPRSRILEMLGLHE